MVGYHPALPPFLHDDTSTRLDSAVGYFLVDAGLAVHVFEEDPAGGLRELVDLIEEMGWQGLGWC